MTTTLSTHSFVSVASATYIDENGVQTSDCFVHGPLGTLPVIVSIYTDRFMIDATVYGDLGEGNRLYHVPVGIVPLLIGVASSVGWADFVSMTLAHAFTPAN